MKAVYDFSEASGSNKKLLGGKGAGLSEMTRLKLPVPPGFVITTEVCKAYYANGKKLNRDVLAQVNRNIAKMEKKTGKGWNDPNNPLLVSVRSGAAISMPGMMDTILNLGLNDSTVNGLAAKSSNPRFAWDSYSIVSIMPGIDIAAPERTDTRRGLFDIAGSFHPLPVFFSIFAMLRFTCARTSRFSFLPFA